MTLLRFTSVFFFSIRLCPVFVFNHLDGVAAAKNEGTGVVEYAKPGIVVDDPKGEEPGVVDGAKSEKAGTVVVFPAGVVPNSPPE